MTTIDRRQLLRGAAASAAVAVVAKEALTMPAAYGAHKKLGEAVSLDDRPFPAYDYTRANKLPREMTGFWEKSFDIGGVSRTAKVYISPETPIRSYYTVIAVPDGVDTAEFLRRSSWRDVADRREEGLFVLESGANGWGTAEDEAAYVDAAMSFYQSNRYFSIYGLHYLVGYGAGAPALEAWAVAHPLRVISQVYLDSPGLPSEYLNAYAGLEFDGTTDGPYTNVVFPDGFDLIRYDETVLPTWYIHPDQGSVAASLSYWKQANDTNETGNTDRASGTVFRQRTGSDRWMTSHAGAIAQVAVLDRPVSYWDKRTTAQIVDFLTYYTRYENVFAYGNQLYERADFAALGIEVRTMMVEGFIREYLVYVPESAARRWGDEAPVVFVWPGNSQTDKVFIDATQWWKVAEQEGFILVIICEQYSNTSISVSHRDSNAFYRQLRELLINEYAVDPTRFYSTGQSAGSSVSQIFAIAFPEYFAAVASTSFTAAPNAAGTVSLDGVAHPARGQMIPNYHIYGYGDLSFLYGGLWDDAQNRLDDWAEYHLEVNGLKLDDVDDIGGTFSGWLNRHQTWTWHHSALGIPVVKLTKNIYRSHNTMAEESPMMWDFLKHYSHEVDAVGNITQYYSPSGFDQPRDRIRLLP
ncbi:MAG TPA: PHB depolymerase family esterase [Jiangellaceae bacterium]